MIKENLYIFIVEKILYSKNLLRPPLMKKLDKMLHKAIVEDAKGKLKPVMQKKYEFFMSMLKCVLNNVDKGYISKEVMRKMMRVFIRNALNKDPKQIAETKKKYGDVPSFIVLSPTSKCNLKCTGCYAAVADIKFQTLPYKVVDKIVDECCNKFYERFMTISGGEPFLYKDEGKTLFDIWKKYNQMFFLVYTNGHFITPEIAKKLAECGNVTVAISVEGMEKETDERRGPGSFKKVLTAFKNLREAGVPFGISVTTTTKNAEMLLQDKFYDFYFNKQGVSYMWQFQLMPVGHGRSAMELTISPQQRLKLYRKWEELMKNQSYCIADFWNSGVLSDGCLAYGKDGGYLYINWEGNVMPCVFVPYYVDNVVDLYKKGKSLWDALHSEFFKRGRKWQSEYQKKKDNWLMPCSIRDHYDNWRKNIATPDVKGENKDAEAALKSKDYKEALDEFDKAVEKLTVPIWNQEYLCKCKKKGKSKD